MYGMLKTSTEFLFDFDLMDGDAKYRLRKLCKYTGGSTHLTITLPTYLVKHLEIWTESKSLFLAFIIEDYLIREEVMCSGIPSLPVLYKYMLAMDRFAQKVKREGGRTKETDRVMRAYKAYIRRFMRVLKRRMNEISGIETVAAKPRVVIPGPYLRSRPDRRRQTDSESEQELGAEAYVDRTDEKNEMYRTDRARFKRLWPDEYSERRRQDEQRLEDERQDPPDWKEDGDDPPEK